MLATPLCPAAVLLRRLALSLPLYLLFHPHFLRRPTDF